MPGKSTCIIQLVWHNKILLRVYSTIPYIGYDVSRCACTQSTATGTITLIFCGRNPTSSSFVKLAVLNAVYDVHVPDTYLCTRSNISSLQANSQRISGAQAVSRALGKLLSRNIDIEVVLALQRPSLADTCTELSDAMKLLESWKAWFLKDLHARGENPETEECRKIVELGEFLSFMHSLVLPNPELGSNYLNPDLGFVQTLLKS
jgi:hypothetical protein